VVELTPSNREGIMYEYFSKKGNNDTLKKGSKLCNAAKIKDVSVNDAHPGVVRWRCTATMNIKTEYTGVIQAPYGQGNAYCTCQAGLVQT
jgi:hypothetical protein